MDQKYHDRWRSYPTEETFLEKNVEFYNIKIFLLNHSKSATGGYLVSQCSQTKNVGFPLQLF